MTMAVAASVLRWGFLVAGCAVLVAFSIAALRRRRAGSGFGQLVEVMESEWFSAGKVFFAVLVGIAGSWVSAYVGGARTGLAEAVPVVFPMGIVASFVVCRYAREGGSPMRVKVCALVFVPLTFGAVMTGW
ncbi:hypothetical protein ACIP93_16595 [Streptomyces sp. NPDC088745]|uniref:hypothetical protein n=1 Tax=Streptomyces sp. NPDC088745 TaxID=3365884 RepID=UPI0038200E1A